MIGKFVNLSHLNSSQSNDSQSFPSFTQSRFSLLLFTPSFWPANPCLKRQSSQEALLRAPGHVHTWPVISFLLKICVNFSSRSSWSHKMYLKLDWNPWTSIPTKLRYLRAPQTFGWNNVRLFACGVFSLTRRGSIRNELEGHMVDLRFSTVFFPFVVVHLRRGLKYAMNSHRKEILHVHVWKHHSWPSLQLSQ